ncbi:MAG: hypothetical protein EXR99_13040 [Gemmataceae bacterium]|nr:hypothetical protein [Gemmataceae bacterium]
MAFQTSCPECGFSRQVDDQEIGSRRPCPKCNLTFLVLPSKKPASNPALAQPEGQALPQPLSKKVSVSTRDSATELFAAAAKKNQAYLEGDEPATQETPKPAPLPPVPKGKIFANVHGLIGTSCLGMALLLANFPFSDYLAIPLACLGIIAAALGLPHQTSFAARVTPCLALLFGGSLLSVLIFSPSWLRSLPAADVQPRPDHLQMVSTKTGLANPGKDQWMHPEFGLQLRDVRIRVASTKYFIPVEARNQPKDLQDQARKLALQLRIMNTGLERAIPFKGWNSRDITVTIDGKKRANWQMKTPLRATGEIRIPPGTAVDQVLYYDFPDKQFTSVRVEIAGSVFEIEENFRFEIPKELIQ